MKQESFLSKSLLLLTASHAVTDLTAGALPAMLPFLKSTLQLSYTQVGMIVLIQNITSSVIQPAFGYVSDKISLPWLVPIGIFLSGAGMAATGFAPSYAVLLAIVVISGLGIAAFHPQSSRAASVLSAPQHKGRSMGLFSVGGNLGGALGSIFIVFLLTLPGGVTNTLYFGIPAAAMALLAWRSLPDISPPQATPATSSQSSGGESSKIPWGMLSVLLAFIFVRSSVHTGLTTYIPLYYIDYLQGDPLYASYLLSAFLLAGVAGTYIGGAFSDRFGRKAVIVFSMAASIPLIYLIQYTSGLMSIFLVALTGMTLISSFATTIILSHEMMPHHLGMASGLTIGFSIGLGGVGVTILGYIADQFGIPATFTTLTLLPVAGLIATVFLPGTIRIKRHAAG